ncbi:MAG: 4-hydroxy-2-oxovalerate aldolase, partial [Promethearchaeota archaeon]
YMDAANEVLKDALFGMFCIPGIAELKNIETAADHNMGFIRIGTNVTEVQNSEEYIKLAKDYGMFVCANFMKSYTLPPEKFVEKVKLSEKYGADMIYLVDSAGGMFPNEIKNYYNQIRKHSDIVLGFHGHNNLGIAIANSLFCVDLGFEFIDTSLQGIGRSSGNASTELITAALIKRNFNIDLDLLKLLEIGHKFIQPLLKNQGCMPLDVIAGFCDFHSSYMHHIQKFSTKYKVNPAILIIEWSKIDKINVDDDKLEEVAKKIKKEEHIYLSKYKFNNYIGYEQD